MAYNVGGFKNSFMVCSAVFERHRQQKKTNIVVAKTMLNSMIWNLQIVQRAGKVGSECFPLVTIHEFKSLRRYATKSWNQSWF